MSSYIIYFLLRLLDTQSWYWQLKYWLDRNGLIQKPSHNVLGANAASRYFLSLSLSLFNLNKGRNCRFTTKMRQPSCYLKITVSVHRATNSYAFIKACQAIQKRPTWSRPHNNYNKMVSFYRRQLYEFFCQTICFTGEMSLWLEGQAHIALKGFSLLFISYRRCAAVWSAFQSMEKSASVRPIEKKDGDESLRRSRTRSLINLSTLPKSRDERWESALGLLKHEESVEHYRFSSSMDRNFYKIHIFVEA